MDLYLNGQKVSRLNFEATTTIGEIKTVIKDWLEPQGYSNYNIRLFFNNRTELHPSVFGSNSYNAYNFVSQQNLLPDGSIHVIIGTQQPTKQKSPTKTYMLYDKKQLTYKILKTLKLTPRQLMDDLGIVDYDDDDLEMSDFIIAKVNIAGKNYQIIHGFPGDVPFGAVFNKQEWHPIGELVTLNMTNPIHAWYQTATNNLTDYKQFTLD